MSDLNSRLAGRDAASGSIDYNEAKVIAASEVTDERRVLAQKSGLPQEILYFLASDADADVRRAVARNDSTPMQAGLVLARDQDDEVRCNLADRISRLAPRLTPLERDRIGDMVNEILVQLASDQLVKIRKILADALKDTEAAPPEVILRLARDEDISVSVPVLEFSPLLDDESLLEIIRHGSASEPLSAISRRQELSGVVSDAVAGTGDDIAVAALLTNNSAQIREDTLDRLVEQAEPLSSWHEPLVHRPQLSGIAIRRMSGFLAAGLLSDLRQRNDIDPEAAAIVASAMEDRLRDGKKVDEEAEDDDRELADEKALRLFKSGELNETVIADALNSGERSFVLEALALLAEVPVDSVRKVASMASAKGMVAFSWKAGLSMTLAVQLQTRIARIEPGKVLEAGRSGKYPLDEAELRWQLDFFGA
jgi:uncharacterized protein (DUF2336 family)